MSISVNSASPARALLAGPAPVLPHSALQFRPMRIATWNVNSIKQRSENLLAWLRERQPDVVCLQETKCVDEAFPREAIEAAGYNVAVHGQKAFNGVAILSKMPFDDVTPRLPGDDEDSHARFLEASISTKRGVVRVASIYLPNGNPPAGEKYSYKLKWMDRLIHYARERLDAGGAADPGGRLQRHCEPGRCAQSGGLGGRRAIPAADARAISHALQSRLHRSAARGQRPGGSLHVLGLPGRLLAEERRHPDRLSSCCRRRPPTC